MKKVVIIISAIIVIIIATVFYFLRSTSNYRSVYFVPASTLAIIEIPDVVQGWESVINSKMWNHFKTNKFVKEINNDIQTYDSVMQSSKLLLKLLGAKKITVSIHELSKGNFDYIFIVDVGKLGNTKNPEGVLKSVLGSNYKITSRTFKDNKIVEVLDSIGGEYYFLTFSNGQLVFSFSPQLVEQAISASELKEVGLDLDFLTVQSKITNNGLLNLYINHSNLLALNNGMSLDLNENLIHVFKQISYSGFYFDIDNSGLISINGTASISQTESNDFFKGLSSENIDIESDIIIPNRLASLTKLAFNDCSDFISRLMKNLGEEVIASYNENLAGIEKKLKIDIENNLFQWVDKEIVVLQAQPSNLGRDNELALILNATDSSTAAENLNLIWKQIKKKTPVKIKSINYIGYKIDYVAFPGIIQAFFGKAISQLDKPYFSQIGNKVIISNHPQTIKNIIDDYLEGRILAESIEYYEFIKKFHDKTNMFLYFAPPILFKNIRAFVDHETWQKVSEQKEYITCFKHGGINISNNGKALNIEFRLQYEPQINNWKPKYYNANEIVAMFLLDENSVQNIEKDTLPNIIISDLDSKKHTEFFDNGEMKLEVKLKDGKKHGSLKMYYDNGQLKLKGEYDNDIPVGKWKYYTKNGELQKVDIYNN